jgi:hypothetical protein
MPPSRLSRRSILLPTEHEGILKSWRDEKGQTALLRRRIRSWQALAIVRFWQFQEKPGGLSRTSERGFL